MYPCHGKTHDREGGMAGRTNSTRTGKGKIRGMMLETELQSALSIRSSSVCMQMMAQACEETSLLYLWILYL